jgi:hypothetical protein
LQGLFFFEKKLIFQCFCLNFPPLVHDQPNSAAANPFVFAASPLGSAVPGAPTTPMGGHRHQGSVGNVNAASTALSPFSFDPLSPSTSVAAPVAPPPSASYFDPLANANPFISTQSSNPFLAPASQPSPQVSPVASRSSAFDFGGDGLTRSSALGTDTAKVAKSTAVAVGAGADPFASFGESFKSAPSRNDTFGDDFEFAPQALPARAAESRTPKSSTVSLPSPKAAAEAASASSSKDGRRRSSSSRDKSANFRSVLVFACQPTSLASCGYFFLRLDWKEREMFFVLSAVVHIVRACVFACACVCVC